MFKKLLTLVLAGWMIVISGEPYSGAQTQTKPNNDPQGQHASKVKSEIQRRSTGQSAWVTVELYDKSKLSGHIAEVGVDQFVLQDSTTGKGTNVLYSSVKKLQGDGPGIARIIALGAGASLSKTALIVLAGLFVALIVVLKSDKS